METACEDELSVAKKRLAVEDEEEKKKTVRAKAEKMPLSRLFFTVERPLANEKLRNRCICHVSWPVSLRFRLYGTVTFFQRHPTIFSLSPSLHLDIQSIVFRRLCSVFDSRAHCAAFRVPGRPSWGLGSGLRRGTPENRVFGPAGCPPTPVACFWRNCLSVKISYHRDCQVHTPSRMPSLYPLGFCGF